MPDRTCSGVATAVARALSLSALAVFPALGSAQETVALEEVIVTAERRATALQDTPLSIIALSAETLEEKGVEDLQDMARYTPNLAIQGGRGSGDAAPSFVVRGVSGGGGATGERGVALYIDGIYVPRTSGSVFKVFDLERIEVLRGPQGTLFGRNSTGGAIRMVTKQPTQEFESYLRGTFGNFSRTDFSGMVNVPLTDTLALRGQAAYLSQDGHVRRGTQLLGSSEDKLGRLQLAWTPNDFFKATFGAFYNDSESDGSPSDITSWDMSPNLNYQGNFADWMSDAFALAGQPRLAVVDDPRLLLDDYTMPAYCFVDDFDPDWDKLCELSNNSKFQQYDANLQFTLSENTSITSVTGYSRLHSVGSSDWQMIGFERRPSDVESAVLYQEVQLNTVFFGGKVDFVAGVNYFREDSESARNANQERRGTSTFSPQAANGNLGNRLFIRADGEVDQTTDSYGAFSTATWHITDKFNFTAGARFSYDEKDYTATAYRSDDFAPPVGLNSTTVTTDNSWTDVDWRATFDYHFTRDLMGYATASKAHKAGSISYTILQNVSGPAQSGDYIKPLAPEEVVNLEAGFRATLFNGRVRFNPTGFYMAWTDRQAARQVSCVAEGPTACPTGFRPMLVSVGDVDLWGYELDTQVAITDNLTFDGSLGVTKGKVRDPVAAGGPNLFPDQASPTWNVGATWSQPTANSGSYMVNLSYAFLGEQETHNTIGTDSAYTLPSYGLLNGRVQWISPERTEHGVRVREQSAGQDLRDLRYPLRRRLLGRGRRSPEPCCDHQSSPLHAQRGARPTSRVWHYRSAQLPAPIGRKREAVTVRGESRARLDFFEDVPWVGLWATHGY